MAHPRPHGHHPTGPAADGPMGPWTTRRRRTTRGRRGPNAGDVTAPRPGLPSARCSLSAVDALRTEALSKRYGVRRRGPLPGGPVVPALSDLSIRVNAGEIFGFLGPNGAGKSTMIRLLLGFLHPTAGRAEVLGLDSERASVEIRRRVGYLPGGIALYDGMAGVDLLDYLGQLYGRKPVRRAELLDRLELSERTLRRPVRDYSRGMRQKIGIVQALQHDPELAILDEPTEGLDPLMQRAFYDVLDERRKAGRTVFFSSHVLSEVERLCDRVAIIRAGEMVALSNVPELLAHRQRHVEIVPDWFAPFWHCRRQASPSISAAARSGIINS